MLCSNAQPTYIKIMHINLTVILAAVNNKTPKQAYEDAENDLIEQLPTDQSEFIALLEREGVIDEELKKEMNVTSHVKDHRTVAILEDIRESFSVSNQTESNDKFNKLLSAMKKYNHGLEKLALKIENQLDPGTYVYIHI